MSIVEQYNNELYHYGVKGMKWGVRRDRKTAQQLAKKYAKASKRGNVKALRRLDESDQMTKFRENSELKNAVSKRRQAEADYEKLENDFYNNSKLVDKYQRKVAKEFAKEQGISFDDAYKGFVYDDWDQGDSYRQYVKETGIGAKERKALLETNREVRNICEKMVNDYLGEYGDTPVKQPHANTIPAKQFIKTRLEFSTYENRYNVN